MVSETVEGSSTVDGRTARARRTRAAIVDACIALVEDGDLQPTAPRVAQRAGVSVRSIFQHFDDLDGLYAAVGDRLLERLAGLVLRVDADVELERRLPLAVRQRVALLEAVTPIRRAAVINGWNSPEVTQRLRLGHAFLRAEIEAAFAHELAAAGEERDEVLAALDGALSWAIWDHFRTTARFSRAAAVAAVERLVRAILAPYS